MTLKDKIYFHASLINEERRKSSKNEMATTKIKNKVSKLNAIIILYFYTVAENDECLEKEEKKKKE